YFKKNEMEKNIWIKILENYCNKNIEDKYGFTIPFIIGLERHYNKRIDFNIRDIFNDLQQLNDKFILSNCPDLEELIIGKHKTNYPNINTLKVIEPIKINTDELININTIIELISILENKYDSKISSKLYSKNYDTKNWSFFDKYDDKMINKLLEL
ncbi:TPA: hypothetical protein ACT4TI_002391, partial [Flavobacterium psychrophilum]